MMSWPVNWQVLAVGVIANRQSGVALVDLDEFDQGRKDDAFMPIDVLEGFVRDVWALRFGTPSVGVEILVMESTWEKASRNGN
jgi:hypothetical protein